MRPDVLWRYYLARLELQPVQELLALVGIAAGVALVFAVQVANTSLVGSVDRLVHGITGSATVQLTARDPSGFDQALLDRVQAVQGVRLAPPLLEQRAAVAGPRGARTVDLVGTTPALASLGGLVFSKGPRPQKPVELPPALLLPSSVAGQVALGPGRAATVTLAGRRTQAPVSGILTTAEIGDLAQGPIAVAPLSYVQSLAGLHRRLTRILVATSAADPARVRAELARRFGASAEVGPANREAQLIRQAAGPLGQSTELFAAMSALIGILFAFTAMLLTVPERRRFTAELRLQGFSTAQVATQIGFEALCLGVAASVVGLLLGDQLSRHVFQTSPAYLGFAFPVGDQRVVTTHTILLSAAAGIIATLAAAARPLTEILSPGPLDAIVRREGDPTAAVSGRGRWLSFSAGGALLGGAGAAVALAPSLAVAAAVALAIVIVLLLPALIPPVLRLAALASRRVLSGPMTIAISELESAPTHAVAVAATAALALFGNVAIGGAHRDLLRGLDRGAHGLTGTSDLWITPAAPTNALATMPLDASDLTARVASTPGVMDARSYYSSFLDYGRRRVWVIGRPAADRFQIPPGQVVAGDAAVAASRIIAGGWAAVSRAVADEHHLRLGQRFLLPTPSGPRRFRLAALLTNVGWAPGTVIMSAADYHTDWPTARPTAVELDVAPGVSAAQEKTRVETALGAPAGLLVQTAAERWALMRASARKGLDRLTQISRLALIAAALAIAAAIGAGVWQRRSRLAQLRVQGFSYSQVWAALLAETAILGGFGGALGAVFGLYGERLAARWLVLTTGFPTVYQPAGMLALATFLGITGAALAVAALPGLAAAAAPLHLAFTEE
jgi:putative ABC transport system permease protein